MKICFRYFVLIVHFNIMDETHGEDVLIPILRVSDQCQLPV